MAVLPADRVINMEVMKTRIGCSKLALASERQFADRFEPCRPGAMPPFGRFFGLPIFCDRTLAEKSEIEFNAGTHIDTVRMRFSEFAGLERPVFTDFAQKRPGSGEHARRECERLMNSGKTDEAVRALDGQTIRRYRLQVARVAVAAK
jgi:hypothetical protein